MKRYISLAFWAITAMVGCKMYNTPDKGGCLQSSEHYSQSASLCNHSETYAPVCGCNDVTYYNSCYASRSVKSHTPGPCSSSRLNDTMTFLGNSKFQDKKGNIYILGYTHSESDALAWYRKSLQVGKKFELSLINLSGGWIYNGSKAIGASCNTNLDPVCGSDGVCYINSCYADYLKKSYTLGVCPNAIYVDSLTYLGGNANGHFFKTSAGQEILVPDFSLKFGSQDEGEKFNLKYIKVNDDVSSYYFLW